MKNLFLSTFALFAFSFSSQAQETYPPNPPGELCLATTMQGCITTPSAPVYWYDVLLCGPYKTMPTETAFQIIREYLCQNGEFPEHVYVERKFIPIPDLEIIL